MQARPSWLVPLADSQLRRLIVGLIGLLALASIVAGLFHGRARAEHALHEELLNAVSEIQHAVERYSVNASSGRNWVYPTSIRELQNAGLLSLPTNPYTGLPVPVLQPGDRFEAGGVVYLNNVVTYQSQYDHGSPRSEPVTHSYSVYVLLIYGAKPRRISNLSTYAFGRLFGCARDEVSLADMTEAQRALIAAWDSIEWDYAAVQLESGLD